MGRVGALSAGVGSYNVVYGYTAFGTGWGDTVGAKSLFNLGDRDRMDNTVTYVTPKFGAHSTPSTLTALKTPSPPSTSVALVSV